MSEYPVKLGSYSRVNHFLEEKRLSEENPFQMYLSDPHIIGVFDYSISRQGRLSVNALTFLSSEV